MPTFVHLLAFGVPSSSTYWIGKRRGRGEKAEGEKNSGAGVLDKKRLANQQEKGDGALMEHLEPLRVKKSWTNLVLNSLSVGKNTWGGVLHIGG